MLCPWTEIEKTGCQWAQEFHFGHADFEVPVRYPRRRGRGLYVPEADWVEIQTRETRPHNSG